MLSAYLKQSVPFDEAIPGAAIAVHSFGDFQQFNPHLHLIVTDGCFFGNGTFTKGPAPEPIDLQDLFRYEVLKMLKAKGKINDAVIENMLGWRHSGFNVYCGPTIWPNNDQGLEDLVRYYGYYSNKSRGMRKKAGMDDKVSALVESAVSSAAFRRNRARLIQKIYQMDPLLCPKCQ